jgi:hypothetical protein
MSHNVKVLRSIFLAAVITTLTVGPSDAQPSDILGWRWSAIGNVFAGLNYQYRELEDLRTVESQNWFMGQGERPIGHGQLSIHAMVSLEPFTLKKIGSPQVFQTGESFNGSPLIDYQHPHDLYSTLSASYARPLGPWTVSTTAAIVGAPALGPPAFMHRPSAVENPQSPLAHHHLDSVTSHLESSQWDFCGPDWASTARGSADVSLMSSELISTLDRSTPGRFADHGCAVPGARSCQAHESTSRTR